MNNKYQIDGRDNSAPNAISQRYGVRAADNAGSNPNNAELILGAYADQNDTGADGGFISFNDSHKFHITKHPDANYGEDVVQGSNIDIPYIGTDPNNLLIPLMTIQPNGNVGFGTASPGKKLEISHGYQSLGGYINTYRISGVTGGIVFGSRQGGGAYVDTLYINDSGAVGIGDSSPSYKLDVPIGNQVFLNGVRFFRWGSNTANQTIDSGVPMKGYGGGGSVLLFFSFHNAAGDATRTDVYILRKSYDANWVSDSTSVHTICSLKGSSSQTGTLTLGFNGSHLTTSYSQGGAQSYYALSFDDF